MWDEKYARDGYLYGTDPNGFLRENLRSIPEGKVLCLADGEGRNSVFLAEQGYNVTAVDQSGVGIAKGRKLAAERGVSVDFIHADLDGYDPGVEKWDGIVSIFCHLLPPLRAAVHARAIAGLKPGGVFLLEGYRPAQLENGTGGPPVAELMHTGEALAQDFAALDIRHLAEVDREIVEGSGHTGTGSVIQMIAIK